MLHVFEGSEFNQVPKFKLKRQSHKEKVKVTNKIGLKLTSVTEKHLKMDHIIYFWEHSV